uniref:Golgi associated RAB2 interactor protein-like Rab2B-binding domain-containing protein n=1 Tax=Pseudonaja textilis TaxID=8673 RepID=A0A670ZV35_PSETE
MKRRTPIRGHINGGRGRVSHLGPSLPLGQFSGQPDPCQALLPSQWSQPFCCQCDITASSGWHPNGPLSLLPSPLGRVAPPAEQAPSPVAPAGGNQEAAGLGANGPAGLTKRGLALQLTRGSRVGGGRFPQVTKKGKWMDITHTPTIVTLAVTSSDPCLPLPNVLLMLSVLRAPPPPAPLRPPPPRLLPLRYVQLSVHSASQRILRLQTVTKTVYYLQLHHKHPEAVFALWSRLANILENGLSTTTKDPAIPIRHCLVSKHCCTPEQRDTRRVFPRTPSLC